MSEDRTISLTLAVVRDGNGSRVMDLDSGEDLTEALGVEAVEYGLEEGRPVAYCKLRQETQLIIGGPRVVIADPRSKELKAIKRVEFTDGSKAEYRG